MTTKLDKEQLIEEAKETLRKLLPVGSELYVFVTKGNWIKTMAPGRNLDGSIRIVDNNIDPRYADYWIGILLSIKSDMYKGLLMSAYGGDRGHEIAYRLGLQLYKDGTAIKSRWMS